MIVSCADVDIERIIKQAPKLKNRRGNPSGKKRHYMGLVTAFDIETTLLPDINQSVMYIWQWQFGPDVTVIGRTWPDFMKLVSRIKTALPDSHWLVVYVHNLSYEFQYLKGIYPFLPEEVFAIASRQVLKCDMLECLEFRCSFRLTNMSLKAFTSKMNVAHQKLSGEDFDYSKVRYPWTPLSDQELAYCVNDVLGLTEAIYAQMERDGDTLQTIPLTSTGYVRRNAKRAMRSLHHNYVHSILPDYELYKALREAFRGGNTHANRFFAGDIVKNVHSADRSSSYPAVICNNEFPMSIFVPILEHDLNLPYIQRCITIRHKALLLRIGIKNLRLRNYYTGCPYLSSDKCRNLHRPVDTLDNGRLLSADYLETTITDIDLKIILRQYDGEIIILQGWYSSYHPLPQPLINEVISYYRQKTELKGVDGQEIYYDKSKALLNSLYGMMAQDPVKAVQYFRPIGDFDTDYSLIELNDSLTPDQKETAITELEYRLLEKSNDRAFLAYQWGVWVTAWARWALEEGIRLVEETDGAEFVYCDTDSVKYIGDVDWSGYNADRIAECQRSGAYATDPKGITHYMGVFESEDQKGVNYAYAEFKTLGAKKYAYTEKPGGECHCTIAGVSKRLGGPELDKHGGLSAFAEGFVFYEAGGTMAVYNDAPEVSALEIDGHTLQITANVAILPSEYTLGITGEYERIIKFAKNYLYNPYII